MTKVKTFNDYAEKIDKEINDWLENNDVSIQYPPTTILGISGKVIITIVYSE